MNSNLFWTRNLNTEDNVGYGTFSKKHLLMLLGVILFTFLITSIYIHSNVAIQSVLRKSIAIILIISEIMKLFVIHRNHEDVLNYIPIEICSFGAYCIVIDAFHLDPTFVRVMLLILFLPAAIMALIYPTTESLPAFNFFTIHQFVFHGLIVAYVIMRFVFREIVIDYPSVWKSIFTILCIASVVYIIDRMTNRNYMFLTGDENNSMLKKISAFSGGGIKYTLTLVLFCIFMIHVFFFIFQLLEKLVLS